MSPGDICSAEIKSLWISSFKNDVRCGNFLRCFDLHKRITKQSVGSSETGGLLLFGGHACDGRV